MNTVDLIELTNDELMTVEGGAADGFSCFAAGLLTGLALGSGNLWAAAGGALYLYTNC